MQFSEQFKKIRKDAGLTQEQARVLMLLGFMCFVIKALSVEYIDSQGILHESFFLIPTGYLFLFTGAVVVLATFIHTWIKNRKNK